MHIRQGLGALRKLSVMLLVCCAMAHAEAAEVYGVQRAEARPQGSGKAGFTLMNPRELGISFTNTIPEAEYMKRQNLMNGAGVALGDFDGDGWCDIYLCNKFGPNALYRNLGNWKFKEVAAEAGVACPDLISSGAVFGDVNGDGKLDLLVTSFAGPNALFLNAGHGKFTNASSAWGLPARGGATSAALADLDGDGDLDLYVCFFGMEAVLRDGASFATRIVRGQPVVTGRFAKRLRIMDGKLVEFGEPDLIFRNTGSKFEEVPWGEVFLDEEGKPSEAPPDFGLAVQIRDINGDGLPDIYVCNDFQTPDQIWLNQGQGKFRPAPQLAVRNMSYASMGVDFADIDRDGRMDFITVEMLSRDHQRHLRQSSPMAPTIRGIGEIETREEVARNALYWNRGDGTYAEIAWFSGVAASDWSWTPIFLDADLDGYEDLFISNGHLRDVNDRDAAATLPPADQRTARAAQEAMKHYPELRTPNGAWRNRGNLRFEETSAAWGFDSTQITFGMALGDLDNDGDLEIVGNCANSGALIYRNDASAPRVAVRLLGKTPNTQGIGAKITLHGGPFPQTQEIVSGGRYLSGDDAVRTFAAPQGGGALSLEVQWPGGAVSRVTRVQANSIYVIAQESATDVAPSAKKAAPAPVLFEDISGKLNHSHQEQPFDDFVRQPLLPKKLSQLGPGLAWFDLDQDGFEELIIGSGKGAGITVFQNARGELKEAKRSPALPDDATSILAFEENGASRILAGMARYERPQHEAAPAFEWDPRGQARMEYPPVADSSGPMAMADVDGDGDLDLFIGGRFVPGRYPEPASSRLYLRENGKFVQSEKADATFQRVGLVSAALFTDVDNDGFPELALACEWGPVRLFKNDRGQFTEVTSAFGLSHHLGLWTSITSGDFDGDGRMDLAAGNWGLNSSHQRAPAGPWFLYHGDANNDGRPVVIEAYFNPEMNAVVPMRDLQFLEAGLPWLKPRAGSHQAFASASLAQLLGEQMSKMTELKAVTLASTIFWNRGSRFEPEALPDPCQWTPVFGMNVADFDGDGHEDLFLAQNFFSVRPEDDRQDSGRGLLLTGTPDGKLKPMAGQESGILIYGGQRGSAAADFDGDGRMDLAVAQNGAATRLLQNKVSPTGLRVRLQGPPGNPNGYGAILRLSANGKPGPAREIHCGSGYWSQDSAVQVFHGSRAAAELLVQWPGGNTTRYAIPAAAREIVVNASGAVQVLR